MAKSSSARRIIGVRERLEMKRIKREASDKPDPWIMRKFTIGLAAAVFGYSIYVVVVRVCVFAITGDDNRRFSAGSAAVVLVIECILLLMFIWSYLRVITTPPGYARDHVPRTSPPSLDGETKPTSFSPSSSNSQVIAGPPYRSEDAHQNLPHEPHSPSREGSVEMATSPAPASTPVSRSHDDLPATDAELAAEEHPQAGAIGAPIAQALATSTTRKPAGDLGHGDVGRGGQKEVDEGGERSGNELRRMPPPVALREEKWRYCKRCELVKPLRTHHCRHCGTCVLAMDHHCPWVGLCVGARNHKYFFNFVQWASIYTLYVAIVLVINLALPTLSGAKSVTDAFQIVMLILAMLFTLFTWGMMTTHMWLLLHNVTTIESMGIARLRDRESFAITRAHGYCNLVAKRRYLKKWNHEWGDPMRQGHPFWLGWKNNWASVMGDNKLGWFLPIPARPSAEDGLNYELNPRYSADGRWQTREHWPKEYQ